MRVKSRNQKQYQFKAVGNTLYISLGDGEPPEFLTFFSQSDDVKRIADRHNEIIADIANAQHARALLEAAEAYSELFTISAVYEQSVSDLYLKRMATRRNLREAIAAIKEATE